MLTDPPVPSSKQHGEQGVMPLLLVVRGIQPPTGLNLSAKNKDVNWKIYKQQWENYSIVAQLGKQPEEYRSSGTIPLLNRTRCSEDIQ